MKESELIRRVREQCVERDGHCRVGKNLTAALGQCGGATQWAHFDSFRRSKTRNLPPEERHTVPGSLMLCMFHHMRYDGQVVQWGNRFPRIWITALTPELCNGPLAFECEGRRFEEEFPYVLPNS